MPAASRDDPLSGEGYVPVMMAPGWVLERHYGWSLLSEGPRLKLLRKRRGPVRTFLLLARGASEEELDDAARRHGLVGPLAIAVVNDFGSGSDASVRRIAGARFRRVEQGRWFGIGTFVVDLERDLASLFAGLDAAQRTACRRAESLGARVESSQRPSPEGLQDFLRLYAWMARERRLETPRRALLESMAASGDLLLASCRDASGATLASNLVYLSGGQGCFLYGARSQGSPAWAGALLQWETVRRLKAMGTRWYDLGLVASRERSDGIYRFKQSIGGRFVDFGREFQRVPRGLAAAYAAFRGLRHGLRGL